MAVSAAELPAMSSAVGTPEEVAGYLRGRLDAGLERIAFFIVPSAVAFLALGDIVAGVLFQSGRFTRSDTVWVWQVLAGSTIGLLAATWGRLYSSTFYALRDTRTPLKFAIARVTLNLALGATFALYLPRAIGLDPKIGVAGLTAASGMAAWVEFFLLRRALRARIGRTSIAPSYTIKLWGAAILAAAAAWGGKLILPSQHTIWTGLGVLAIYGVVYLGVTSLIGIKESRALTRRLGIS
jgi:putative peptidoglycan lipid II flippase